MAQTKNNNKSLNKAEGLSVAVERPCHFCIVSVLNILKDADTSTASHLNVTLYV